MALLANKASREVLEQTRSEELTEEEIDSNISRAKEAAHRATEEEEDWTSVLRELEHSLLCNQPTLSKNVSSATSTQK